MKPKISVLLPLLLAGLLCVPAIARKNTAPNGAAQVYAATLKAARAGNVSAQSAVARMSYLGYGTSPNLGQATHWAQLAAAKNDPRAQFLLGLIQVNQAFANGSIHSGPLKKSESWFRKVLANRASSPAQKNSASTMIGFLLASIGKDSQSRKILAAPLSRREPLAEFIYSMTWAPARPGTLPLKALESLTVAGSNGFVPADIALGLMYMEGSGVPQNPSMAKRWLKLTVSDLVVSDDSLETQNEVFRGITNADKAGNGNPAYQYNLGVGELLDGETREAVAWFQLSARKGYLPAQLALTQLALGSSRSQLARAAVNRGWFIGAMMGTLSEPAQLQRWLPPVAIHPKAG